ncbi:MAG: sigma 54-interacting transcriptional regulator [Nitrospirae bacterium]|nr:sigma 54-interacting transcriptional regulator [Nitrospirota bacterium]
MNKNVLVIDDEESIRFTFESFLSEEGYAVTTAGDYDEALAKIDGKNFDIIFADIILGDKSGIDILRLIRNKKINSPVIMITGYPNVETASEAVRIGAFDYISKPVRQATLLHVANKALRHKTLQEENEKYRSNLEAIFGSVKDAIITVDKDLIVLAVNKSAEEICGISRDYIGRPFVDYADNCRGKCLDVIKKTIASKQPMELSRTECQCGNHARRVVTISASPLLSQSGAFAGAVMVVRDETFLNDLERNLRERRQFHNIIGQNEKMQDIYALIEDLADVQTTVLITGESGTGKELVADAIHYTGVRSGKPLVKVNCAALSENLLESELFGHVKGAFTGADRDKVGRFQKADGGTLFLDEIGDISPATQVRLLRVLQEKVLERVGDSNSIKVDVRVITATNQDLQKKVRLGKFRKDLYYRLKVMELALPPLRERKDDIPGLLNYFLRKLSGQINKKVEAVSEDVQKLFLDYPWPGNIRELENALEHAIVVCKQDTVTVEDLPQGFKDFIKKKDYPAGDEAGPEPKVLMEALVKSGWNKSKAARLLGVTVRTIYRKMEKYNITSEKTY